ncbi:MAG: S46 family peptidase [Blastocatellia bacterium]
MPGKSRITLFLILSLLITTPFGSFADEGMWLPDTIGKLPLSQMKKRGFELKPEEIWNTVHPSLKDAIVQISIGGTGSFISPDGLILTNHHVAFSAITAASSPENDYISKGFLARTRADEVTARNYTISVTQDYKDVTAEVLSAAKPEMSPEARQRAITEKQQEIAKAAANGREKDGIRTQVVEATGGLQYFLYTYLTVRDVRLVYGAPKMIGYFGGDPDNFEWPRHCGDFSLLRAYVAPDGKPAAFSKENVPFKPKKFLPINANGVKEGDFAFIMGYPGATYRYRESYSVEFRQNIQLPDQMMSLRQQIDTLTKLGERDPAMKIRLADTIFGLNNTLKSFEGTVAGLKRMNLPDRKRAEEAQLGKWLDANPAMKAKYGDVLPQIAALYEDLSSFSLKQSALANLLNSGDLVNAVEFAYGRALDKEKPAAERQAVFGEGNLPRVTAQLNAGWGEREPETEEKMLVAALARVAELPDGQRLAYLEKMFEGKSGKARREAEAQFAEQALDKSRFKSFEEVKKLFSASAAEIRGIDDPLLKLIVAAYDENAPLGARVQKFNGAVTKLRPQYVDAMLAMKKTSYYPDANFTLRFTYGDVRGYKPRDAVTYDYQTSLSGVIEKDTGEEPFAVPEGLKQLHKKRDFGAYIDARLNDVPVAFLATTDITGGNSGSPVMNGRGEVIGLAFDGNYEGLGGDYSYDISSNRTLSVDIRYVLFVMEKFAGAGYLFNEMQIKSKTKAVASSK